MSKNAGRGRNGRIRAAVGKAARRRGRPVIDDVAWDWATGERPASRANPAVKVAQEEDGPPNAKPAPSDLVEVPVDSLEAAVGYSSLQRQMQRSYLRRVAFYRTPAGGSLSVEDAREAAFHAPVDEEEAARQLESLMRLPLDAISFADVMGLHLNDPFVAEWFWERAKEEGRAEFESGHAAASATLPLERAGELWSVAKYLGVRESFAAEWKPRGGVETALIDMMAQSYFQWQYWLEQTVLRSQTRGFEEDPEYVEWKRQRLSEGETVRRGEGHWFVPLVPELQAVEHAVQMTDRWHRMFARTLRQLRDLRRYAPVTINHAAQVNVGEQQVNISNV